MVLKKIGLMALALMAVLVSLAGASSSGWGVSYPKALHLGNSSVLYFSNVENTEGWNITSLETGKTIPVDTWYMNETWAYALNLKTGAITSVAAMDWFACDPEYAFRADNQTLEAFKITDAKGAVVLQLEFNGGEAPNALPGDNGCVTNGTMTLCGIWAVVEVVGNGAVVPPEQRVAGEYLVNGEPTGFASVESLRPLELRSLAEQILALQAHEKSIKKI
jgi:hypothetical protein